MAGSSVSTVLPEKTTTRLGFSRISSQGLHNPRFPDSERRLNKNSNKNSVHASIPSHLKSDLKIRFTTSSDLK